MSEIVISGYYGFGNAGDEAMLSAMIEALTDIDPKLNITVISGDPKDTKERHGVNAVYRLNYPEIWTALKRSDLLISGGGSLLQDVTSDRSLYYYLSIMLLAYKAHTPFMLYAQGIGPVRGKLAGAAVKYICNRADLITVRDDGSKRELLGLGVSRKDIQVLADPVLAMHPVDKAFGRNILRQQGLEGAAPLIGLSVREWKDWGYYKKEIARAADYLIDKYKARIVFLPMQYPDDVVVAQKVSAMMRNQPGILAEKYTTGELLSLVGNLDILIGVRLHALIFAAIMNVPCLGISYDPKIERFLETLDEQQIGRLSDVTAEQIVDRVEVLCLELKKQNKVREAKINTLRQQAFLNAELALDYISKRHGGD